MKIFFFCITAFLSIVLLISITKILIVDLPQLTNYGYGYLTGKVLLFLLFGTISFLLIRKKKRV